MGERSLIASSLAYARARVTERARTGAPAAAAGGGGGGGGAGGGGGSAAGGGGSGGRGPAPRRAHEARRARGPSGSAGRPRAAGVRARGGSGAPARTASPATAGDGAGENPRPQRDRRRAERRCERERRPEPAAPAAGSRCERCLRLGRGGGSAASAASPPATATHSPPRSCDEQRAAVGQVDRRQRSRPAARAAPRAKPAGCRRAERTRAGGARAAPCHARRARVTRPCRSVTRASQRRQRRAQLVLPREHLPRVALVIVAEQVQQAVHDERAHLGARLDPRLARLPRGLLEADDDVAELALEPGRQLVDGRRAGTRARRSPRRSARCSALSSRIRASSTNAMPSAHGARRRPPPPAARRPASRSAPSSIPCSSAPSTVEVEGRGRHLADRSRCSARSL